MSTCSIIGSETGSTVERTLAVDESSVYGSSRLGTLKREQWIARNTYDLTTGTPVATNYSTFVPDQYVKDQYRGDKNYELSNHLGNVLVTVSDRRTPEYTLGMFSRFNANVSSAQDYYSFGMIQPGRSFGATVYKFGFQGQEKDDEITGVNGSDLFLKFRIYDSRIGRFLSVDPLSTKYPENAPYAFSENDVIRSIELEGLEKIELSGQAGVTLNIGGKKQNNLSLNLSVGGTYESNENTLLGASFSMNLYNGGLGTHQGTKNKSEFQGDFVLSTSFTFGKGQVKEGNEMPISTFNSLTLTPLENSFQNSFTYGYNFIFNTSGRNQTNASVGFKLGDFTFQTYNDVSYLKFGINAIANDRWWTGGGNMALRTNAGILSWGGDVFTDEILGRREGRATHVGTGQRSGVYSNRDRNINNGLSFVQFQSNQGSKTRINLIGSNQMFWQNGIHFVMGVHYFESKAQNTFQFSNSAIINK